MDPSDVVGEAHGFAGAIDHDERRLGDDLLESFPGVQSSGGVVTDDGEQVDTGVESAERRQGVGGVAGTTGVDLEVSSSQSGDVGDRRFDHRQSVGSRGDGPISLLLPRDVGNHQDHRVQVQGVPDVDGRDQVADVGRVERAAEQADSSDRRDAAAGSRTCWRTWGRHGASVGPGHLTTAERRTGDPDVNSVDSLVILRFPRSAAGVVPARTPTPPEHSPSNPAVSPADVGGNENSKRTVDHSTMNDSIGLYLNDIGKVPLLTAEDERELSRVIEAGREAAEQLANGKRGVALKNAVAAAADAKDRFIRSNLRLVVSIARRYPLPQGMDLLDLIQEGNLGLEHAVDKFDWRRGFKFSTYATFWIRQAIGRALDQKASLIRIPGDRSASLRAALRQASGDGETLDQANAELHRLTTPVSLDKTVGDDGDATLGDLMANGEGTPEDAVMSMVDGDLLDELLGTLDGRARYAVEARFGLLDGERKSFREVGESLGVTAEAARRLVSRAVAGLRDDAERILAV